MQRQLSTRDNVPAFLLPGALMPSATTMTTHYDTQLENFIPSPTSTPNVHNNPAPTSSPVTIIILAIIASILVAIILGYCLVKIFRSSSRHKRNTLSDREEFGSEKHLAARLTSKWRARNKLKRNSSWYDVTPGFVVAPSSRADAMSTGASTEYLLSETHGSPDNRWMSGQKHYSTVAPTVYGDGLEKLADINLVPPNLANGDHGKRPHLSIGSVYSQQSLAPPLLLNGTLGQRLDKLSPLGHPLPVEPRLAAPQQAAQAALGRGIHDSHASPCSIRSGSSPGHPSSVTGSIIRDIIYHQHTPPPGQTQSRSSHTSTPFEYDQAHATTTLARSKTSPNLGSKRESNATLSPNINGNLPYLLVTPPQSNAGFAITVTPPRNEPSSPDKAITFSHSESAPVMRRMSDVSISPRRKPVQPILPEMGSSCARVHVERDSDSIDSSRPLGAIDQRFRSLLEASLYSPPRLGRAEEGGRFESPRLLSNTTPSQSIVIGLASHDVQEQATPRLLHHGIIPSEPSLTSISSAAWLSKPLAAVPKSCSSGQRTVERSHLSRM